MRKYLLGLILALWTGTAGATCTAIPNVFSTGLIFSSQVNANFSYLGTCAAAAGANTDITSLSGVTSIIGSSLSITGISSLTGTFVLPYAQGGTGATSFTNHGVVLGGASALGATVAGAANSVLIGNGGSADPSYSTMTALIDAVFGSTKGQILYRGTSTWLTLNPGSNGQCLAISSAVPLWQNCSTAGVSEPSVTVETSGTAQTYTTPAGATRLWVRLVGGGGAGAGSTGSGGDGADTTFGGLTGGKGHGGATAAGAGGAGGSASGGDLNLPGSAGTTGCMFTGAINNQNGSAGAPGFMGTGAGAGGVQSTSSGGAGGTNTGAGGGGSANDGTHACGSPGGAGGYVEKLIISPAATYTYTVGGGGTAGTGGSNLGGGAGAAGIIIVTAYFD